MPEVIWEDPPGAVSGKAAGAKYSQLAAALRTKPGVWARVGSFERRTLANTIRNAVRRGRTGFEPAGAFEAAVRQVKDEQSGEEVVRVWVRYVGGEDL